MDTVKKYLKYILCSILLLSPVFAVVESVKAASNDIVLTFTDSSIIETVSGSGYFIHGTTLEINKAGTYRIKGSCSEGNIEVKKEVTGVTLILDDLTLTSSKTAPIIIKKDGAQATIKVQGYTTLTDNENPEDEFSPDPEIADAYEGAGIKVKNGSSLTLEGSGFLTVIGNANNGIKGGKESNITVNSGTINISAANSGLVCDGTITINNGNVIIDAYNEGIKLEPDEGDLTSLARFTMNGGRVEIDAGQDGIQAIGDVNINGWSTLEINAYEDGIQTRSNFNMTNGILNIYTFEGYDTNNFDKDGMSAKGIKATTKDETITEGATNTINVTGGTININSSDDGMHSDGYLNITRGTVNVQSGDDGIHADTRMIIGYENGLERDPEIYVNNSIEGIESGNIYMYSGKVLVNAIDDGINAAGGASSGGGKDHGEHFNPDTGQMVDNYAIYVYGGDIFVNCEGDGLDANGSIYLYGGTQIIYHQDAQGNNSALDRDANLVIDGATVFAAGGVADNGHVDDTGSAQNIVIDTTDYPNNSKILVSENGTKIFNDQIPKRSTYTFFSSPTLGTNGSIGLTSELEEDYLNHWRHTYDDGVITTPATESTPGIITYTCDHGTRTERKTVFYKGTVEFSFINKTQGLASVRILETESTSNFTTTDVDDYVYVTTNETIDFIQTYDGVHFERLSPERILGNGVYVYKVDPVSSQTFYVVIDGDVNMDGVTDITDSIMIAHSLLSKTNPLYLELSELEQILADENDNGLINSHDGLAIIKNLPENVIYDESFFNITSVAPVILDGEHDGETTITFVAKKNIVIDAMDGNYFPSEENPSANGYLELTDIQGHFMSQYAELDITNGFAGFVEENGITIPKNSEMVTLKFKVDKNTPSGAYPVTLRINSVTAHDSSKETTFTLKSDVIVKGTTDPTTAFFNTDEGVDGIDVYYTQNYEVPSEYDATSTSVRNPDTGEIIPDGGEGQVNFTVKTKQGYIVSDISVSPAGSYKNIKGPADTEKANTYRITRVTGDIEITVTTKQASEYTVSFDKKSNISSIDLYYTQDYTTPDEFDVNEGFVRNSDTGAIDITGDGQISFRVNPAQGYKVKKVDVSGNYKNLKDQGNRIYRVTKINGDLLVTVTAEKRTEVNPTVSGVQASYTYTGSKIKPSVTVTIPGSEEEITLVNGTDYEVTYGANTNVGTDAGTITIESIDSSDYIFDPITVNFDITKYELTSENINAPAAMVYTGSTLTPEVTVTANNKTLVEGTDYDLSFMNQDGEIGDEIVVIVEGKGNFSGYVNDVTVEITAKANQVITFPEDELTKTYGEDYTMAATLVVGDGTITYSTNNPAVAPVDPNTGAVTLLGTGTVTITATASETETYNRASVRYKLIVKKKNLTIENVTVDDKTYDGTTNANITGVIFDGLVNDDELVLGTDYNVSGGFINAEVGDDKVVNVTVDLSYETLKKYALTDATFEASASIFPIGIDDSAVTISDDSYTYDGTAKEPTVTVVVDSETLTENVDYKVSYIDNVEVGQAVAVIVGIGNYASNTPIVKPFNINRKTVTPTIESIDPVTYNGLAQEPVITVKEGDDVLVLGKDYTAEYSNNIDAGNGNVRITRLETSNYNFDDTDISNTFEIKPYKITKDDIALEYKFVKYDGTAKEPGVTVTANGIVLEDNVDYVVSYDNNTSVTTDAEVTVTAISLNYDGSPSVNFEISDKDELVITVNPVQSKVYSGSPVVLDDITVSYNTDGITPSDLDIQFYDTDDNEIERPTNAGTYYVIYSYDGANYKGSSRVDFEITKAESSTPSEMTSNLSGRVNDKLSDLTITSEGLVWANGDTAIIRGANTYSATYTENNDPDNYTTINLDVPVYGKSTTYITTFVEGTGGSISDTVTALEGDDVTITFTPYEGYEIDEVYVDGIEVLPEDNKIVITATDVDQNVVVSFKTIKYNMNISGLDVNLDKYGIVQVDYNDDETITITSKPGYKLSSVLVNNTDRIADVTNDSITISDVLEDTEVKVTAEKISYEVIEGARQEYIINKHIYAKFKINAEYNLFENGGEVYVDDKLVDPKYYTSEEGSTVITFKQEYMDKLSLGAHTLRVTFNDGGDASCIFRVAILKYRDKEIINPTTGDNLVYLITVLVASVIGIISLIVLKRKKRAN